jgi:hypothetical protein
MVRNLLLPKCKLTLKYVGLNKNMIYHATGIVEFTYLINWRYLKDNIKMIIGSKLIYNLLSG